MKDFRIRAGRAPCADMAALPAFICMVQGVDAEPAAGAPSAMPGDFSFLTGEWRIENKRLLAPSTDWDHFPGEATVTSILSGAGSVEDLRIPARDFAGMGLRLLDRARGIWVDHFVNAKRGVLGAGGQEGRFHNGVGTFMETYEDNGKPIMVRGVWDEITANTCRWRQAVSHDDGKTWGDNWIMHWTRV